MKKTIAFFSLLLCTLVASSQVYKGQIDSTIMPATGPAHYIPEYDYDSCVNPQAWTTATAGMHVAFGSEDELYFRKEVPTITNDATIWQATGWKGERLN